MEQRVPARLRKEFQGGSEDWNDVTFTGQRIRWMKEPQSGSCIEVSQKKKRPLMNPKRTKHERRSPLHPKDRSLLGQINWQSRTQFQCCYTFSRSASRAASPTIGDVKALYKLARQLKSQLVKIHF